ncbi:hypothetical protein EW145_g744 [Phellinidium pouzarii]|uniref:Enoyl-CoA hydratase n=1 Tax=Phellinidium pouzarii TaxID=167371 RepID=A0A4S4LIX8_9AGAM|nr:hypothetical protein EW145_g744 [Phellinidium pouzarii]
MVVYHSTPFIKVTKPYTHVILVELQRKPVNAFNEALWTELGQTFDLISKDDDVRAAVLASGLPKFFSAGIDLNDTGIAECESSDPARTAFVLREQILKFQGAISAMERCRHPVIFAAHGIVYGLGVDIACACDARYVASDAMFSIKEVDIALAADIGTLARISKITGNASIVSELALTARPFNAKEARAFGFVSRVVSGSRTEVVQAALETAQLISQKSPIAITGTKHLLMHARDHSVAENLAYTALWNAAAVQTEVSKRCNFFIAFFTRLEQLSQDIKNAIAAFQSKKPAKFRNLPKL